MSLIPSEKRTDDKFTSPSTSAAASSYELAEWVRLRVTVGFNKVTQCRRGRGRYCRSSNRGSSSHGPTSGDQSDRGGSRGDYNNTSRGGYLHRQSSNRGGFSRHGAMNTCRNHGGHFPHLTPCPAKEKQFKSCKKIGQLLDYVNRRIMR